MTSEGIKRSPGLTSKQAKSFACDISAQFTKKTQLSLAKSIQYRDKHTTEERDRVNKKSIPHVPAINLAEFPIFTSDQVQAAVTAITNSSSPLDIIPVDLLKQFLPLIMTEVTLMINGCIQTNYIPTHWKTGAITPLMKKDSLPPNDLTNYRPVSQLCFWTRLTEKLITPVIQDHLETNNKLHDRQSGFRRGRGTESAVMDMRETVLHCEDKGHKAAVLLLDFSSAFDTVNHALLIERISEWGGITGKALDWLTNFLSGRQETVIYQGQKAPLTSVKSGVPQGSALSPVLFNIYTRPLTDLIEESGIYFQVYADDVQLFLDTHAKSSDTIKISACLSNIKLWASISCLCLNDSKTELLWHDNSTPDEIFPFRWPDTFEAPKHSVRNVKDLGIVVDTEFNFETQASEVIRKANFHIWRLHRMAPLLSMNQRIQLCQALALSHMRYCASIFIGASKKTIHALQMVQNRAIRLICGLRKFDHVSADRTRLGWLPIASQITLQTALWTWKSLNHQGPLYAQQWVEWRIPRKGLRAGENALPHTFIPKKMRKGGRTLKYLGPRVWNLLPHHVKSCRDLRRFKSLLYQHLLACSSGNR